MADDNLAITKLDQQASTQFFDAINRSARTVSDAQLASNQLELKIRDQALQTKKLESDILFKQSAEKRAQDTHNFNISQRPMKVAIDELNMKTAQLNLKTLQEEQLRKSAKNLLTTRTTAFLQEGKSRLTGDFDPRFADAILGANDQYYSDLETLDEESAWENWQERVEKEKAKIESDPLPAGFSGDVYSRLLKLAPKQAERYKLLRDPAEMSNRNIAMGSFFFPGNNYGNSAASFLGKDENSAAAQFLMPWVKGTASLDQNIDTMERTLSSIQKEYDKEKEKGDLKDASRMKGFKSASVKLAKNLAKMKSKRLNVSEAVGSGMTAERYFAPNSGGIGTEVTKKETPTPDTPPLNTEGANDGKEVYEESGNKFTGLVSPDAYGKSRTGSEEKKLVQSAVDRALGDSWNTRMFTGAKPRKGKETPSYTLDADLKHLNKTLGFLSGAGDGRVYQKGIDDMKNQLRSEIYDMGPEALASFMELNRSKLKEAGIEMDEKGFTSVPDFNNNAYYRGSFGGFAGLDAPTPLARGKAIEAIVIAMTNDVVAEINKIPVKRRK